MVGEAGTSCELTVVELPPVFTKKISPLVITAGEPLVVFEAEISKGHGVTKWYKNGTEIKENNRFKLKIDGKTYIINPTKSETSNGITVPKEEITGVICYHKDNQDVCSPVSILIIF